MGELHNWSKHPLSGADAESYFELHVVPTGYQPIGEGDCEYLAQYYLANCGWVGLVNLGRLHI